jgi:hypothetical protein
MQVIEFMEESDTFLPPVVRFNGIDTAVSISRLAAFTGTRTEQHLTRFPMQLYVHPAFFLAPLLSSIHPLTEESYDIAFQWS